MQASLWTILGRFACDYGLEMSIPTPKKPARRCSKCACTPGNTCLTTFGDCFWLAGTDLCGACLFPKIRLHGPLAGDGIFDGPGGPLTVSGLCVDARVADPESIRWFWGVYGRELRARFAVR
jgi:hypothetical protein